MIHSSTYFLPFTLSNEMKYAKTSPVFLKKPKKARDSYNRINNVPSFKEEKICAAISKKSLRLFIKNTYRSQVSFLPASVFQL